MIRSKFDTIQFIGQFVMIGLLILCGFLFYAIFFGKHPTTLFSALGIFGVFLTILLPIYVIAQMKLNYKIVEINTEIKEISFKIFVVPVTYTYPLDHFDGYIDTIVKDKYGKYKCYYLIKDGRLKYKISGRLYTNIDELHEGISDLKYQGFIKYTLPLSIKIALNRAVL